MIMRRFILQRKEHFLTLNQTTSLAISGNMRFVAPKIQSNLHIQNRIMKHKVPGRRNLAGLLGERGER